MANTDMTEYGLMSASAQMCFVIVTEKFFPINEDVNEILRAAGKVFLFTKEILMRSSAATNDSFGLCK